MSLERALMVGEKVSYHFSVDEMKCPCCGLWDMDSLFIEKLEEMREEYNKPMLVTSGFRCFNHNAQVGGSKNSKHMDGLAVDVFCRDPYERYYMMQAAMDVGMGGIGLHKDFIHIDLRLGLPSLWTY